MFLQCHLGTRLFPTHSGVSHTTPSIPEKVRLQVTGHSLASFLTLPQISHGFRSCQLSDKRVCQSGSQQ